MPKSSPKFLAGLIGPNVLKAAESDPLHAVYLDLESCDLLEIRYDFFEPAEWKSLSGRVRRIAPQKKQIGTIRLHRDGGMFPDKLAFNRMNAWADLLKAEDAPEWLDLEQDCLQSFHDLKSLADLRSTKIIVSQHNFLRVPNSLELQNFARDCKRLGADGLKIAAMSNTETDSDRLYQFTKKNAGDFEFFSAFAMGETGKTSRLWSLKEGANLTYGSIGGAAAPGQIDVVAMRKALDQWENWQSPFELLAFLSKF